MGDRPTLRRVRMRAPTSRWRDPDFLVVFMFGAAIVALFTLVSGGYNAYQYVADQADPASRIGICKPTHSEFCVVVTPVQVMSWSSDKVRLRSVDGSQDTVETRIGGAQPSAFPRQDPVWLEWYQGDDIALSDRKTGALMKLVNYPEPAFQYWVPEVSIGLVCLAIWVGLYLYRRRLFRELTVSTS